jgi:hypothetical protein
VIAAQSLGIDSLLTNGIHRGDPQRVWRALRLPAQNCFPAVMLLLGYAKAAPGKRSGRLGSHGTIHFEAYHRRSDAELDGLTAFQSDEANNLWKPQAFFDGPGKRAKTAYANLSPALAKAGFLCAAVETKKE